MTQLRERSTSATRPLPDEAVLSGREHPEGRLPMMLRTIGAIAVLVVGAVQSAAVLLRLQLYFRHRPAFHAQLRGSDGHWAWLARPGSAAAALPCPTRSRRDRTVGDLVRLPVHQRAPAAVRLPRARLPSRDHDRACSRSNRRSHARCIPRHAQAQPSLGRGRSRFGRTESLGAGRDRRTLGE